MIAVLVIKKFHMASSNKKILTEFLLDALYSTLHMPYSTFL